MRSLRQLNGERLFHFRLFTVAREIYSPFSQRLPDPQTRNARARVVYPKQGSICMRPVSNTFIAAGFPHPLKTRFSSGESFHAAEPKCRHRLALSNHYAPIFQHLTAPRPSEPG